MTLNLDLIQARFTDIEQSLARLERSGIDHLAAISFIFRSEAGFDICWTAIILHPCWGGRDVDDGERERFELGASAWGELERKRDLTEERRPEAYMYEETIDLRPYIEALFAWWWLIALCAGLAGAAALLFGILQPSVYEATARIVMLKSQTEISLGSEFETVTNEDIDLAEAVKDVTGRRLAQRLNSMAGLVQNGAIAQQVSEELKGVLTEEERDPSRLLSAVKGRVLRLDEADAGDFPLSDTIEIVVEYDDPDKAAAIANAWSQKFETYVNQIYGDASVTPFTDISQQLVDADAEYESAKNELLTFMAESYDVAELQRQIEEEQAIISTLRSGRQTAIAALVNEDVKAKQQLISAYFDDDQRDLLFALNRKQKLDTLLTEARLMREQLDNGQDVSASSTGLALLALKSRVFSAVDALPFGKLDLQVESLASLSPQQGADEQIADLDALIDAMEDETASLETLIAEQSASLDSAQLTERAGGAVDHLLQMAAYNDVISSSVEDAPLSQEIARREAGIRQLQVEIEQLNSRKRVLEKNRELAWRTYDALLSKQQELDVAAWVKGSEVRFAAPAVPPSKPADSNTIRNTALAGVVGVMLGVGFAFVAEYMDMEPVAVSSLLKKAAVQNGG